MYGWADESYVQSGAGGAYVMVGAVTAVEESGPIRDRLVPLVRRPRRRLHWSDEEPADRRRIIKTLADCPLRTIVVVATPVDPKRQERARRKCAERLLWALERAGVTRVWLETRTPSLNQRDMRLVDSLRGKQAISPGLRVEFARPLEEPMLWVPDAVAGAVVAARKGTPEFRDPIEGMIEEHELGL
jgi:hypothetical protein